MKIEKNRMSKVPHVLGAILIAAGITAASVEVVKATTANPEHPIRELSNRIASVFQMDADDVKKEAQEEIKKEDVVQGAETTVPEQEELTTTPVSTPTPSPEVQPAAPSVESAPVQPTTQPTYSITGVNTDDDDSEDEDEEDEDRDEKDEDEDDSDDDHAREVENEDD